MGQRKGEKMKFFFWFWFITILMHILSVILGIYVTIFFLNSIFLRFCGLGITAIAITNVIAIIDILR